ncbi:divergent polysaccharide deacetylase family protein [Primorskyibacter aestuariivivens]|uniref:polysaccharide deacteylase family 2 protein n=1 Tax=Primorskyibacter aestuariivivens TaxID=1888912 RepID=UPI0023000DDA|nr:polysaccharide deacteylase family 2 protein [Primorskyibacter aestuariivivens]MDA7429038.1 divergent polysaccharide deacetylase family protein [Primorskyibacter aestuariivivens]
MARGFLSGALWGVVVAGLGAGTASVVTGPVFAPRPEVSDETRVPPEAPQEAATEAAPEGALREAVPRETASPGVPDQSAGVDLAENVADTESTGLPQAGGAEELRAAPNEGESAEVQRAMTDPVAGQDQADAPPAPAAEELSISTNPQQPPAPRPALDDSLPQLAGAPETGEAAPAPEAETPVEDGQAPEPIAEAVEPVPEPAVVPMIVEEDGSTQPATKPRVTALLDRAEDENSGPGVGTPAGTFGNLAPDVRTGRLPSLVDDQAGEAPKRPIEAFSEPVVIEGDKPLMSIVLVDDGSVPLGLEALESFPYPITFAVDGAWSGATEAAAAYRAAGFEVMVVADLPPGAQPQDAEVTLSTILSKVPEAVGVLEGDAGGLQENRGASDQVGKILAQTGHGLVLYSKGLNSAQSLARRAGVPVQSLFRDFDGQGQDAKVIRRFLDQAAFKAGQEGSVIMLGRLRAETISALLIWGLQDRASRVTFVPVSQVLLEDGSEG